MTEIKQLGKDVRITLYEKAKLDPAGIPAILAQYRRGLQFKADQEPKFILTPQGRLIEELMKFAGSWQNWQSHWSKGKNQLSLGLSTGKNIRSVDTGYFPGKTCG